MKIFKGIILLNLLFLQVSAQINIDRSIQPKAGPTPTIHLKNPYIYKLSNGMTILILEDHKLPKITSTLFIDQGDIKEGNKAGVTSFMGEMLNEGTTIMNKATFDVAVDKIGAHVYVNESGADLVSLTRYFSKAFALMGQAIRHPAFSDSSFKKIKTRTIASLKASEKEIGTITNRVNNVLAYGLNSPGGEFVTEETINNISLIDVKNNYKKYVTPSNAYLTITGDISIARAKTLVNSIFANWSGPAFIIPSFESSKNPDKTEIDLIDVPYATQCEINIINLVKLTMDDKDYFPMLIANQILGGGFTSWLSTNLREKHAFTYGAYSNIGTGRFQRTFDANASVRNEKVDSAVIEIMYEIRRLRTAKVSNDILNNAKAQYNGSFAINLQNPAISSSYSRNILINNLSRDFYKTYLQKINNVTIEDVNRVANKYLNFFNMRIIIVGDTSKVPHNIYNLGYPVFHYDQYANKIVN